MAAQMDFLIGGYITVCSRIKHESSSSDEEHAAAKPSSTSHLPLLSSVSYKKTLRLTSEQLVRALSSLRRDVGSGPALATRARRVPWTGFPRPRVSPEHLLCPSTSCPPPWAHIPPISVPPVQLHSPVSALEAPWSQVLEEGSLKVFVTRCK